VSHLRYPAAIPIVLEGTCVARCAFSIVANSKYHLITDKIFLQQIQNQAVRHFPDNDCCLFHGIWAGQDLADTHGFAFGFNVSDILNRSGFDTPSVINEELSIYAKEPEKEFFIFLSSLFYFLSISVSALISYSSVQSIFLLAIFANRPFCSINSL